MLSLLDGIRVLDLTKLDAALATCRLADLGADVIKIEEPPHGDYYREQPPFVGRTGMGVGYVMLNRNKRSVGLDLRSPAGREIFYELLETADVVVEVSRPGKFNRRELDYDSLKHLKRDLVYCSVSGYGQTGVYRDLPSHGMNVDAGAGLLRIERGPGGRTEIAPSGVTGLAIELGALHAALAVSAALVRRARTGEGQYLDVSCRDAGMASNSASRRFVAALNLGSADLAPGGAGQGMGARYNVYGTKDDRVIFLGALEKRFWEPFCAAVDRPEWATRGVWENHMDFGDDDPSLRDDVEAVMRTRTADEWMDRFTEFGVPASPVLGPEELEGNPHTADRHLVVTSDHPGSDGVKWVAPPVAVPGERFTVRYPAPQLGEHTGDVLGDLGYDAGRVAELAAEGVVVDAALSGLPI
jgi:crotonobetainyl-CoA:carnitine CoA-transferase CaiB-like acyl-CoA transferase